MASTEVDSAANGNGHAEEERAQFDGRSDIPLWLDGKQVDTKTIYDVVSPNDGKTLYKSASASKSDAAAAIESAHKAFKTWSQTKPAFRRDILLRAADVLLKRKEELRKYSNSETGESDAMFDFEHNLAVQACKTTAGLILTVQGSIPTVADEGKSAMVLRVPFGVVLSIAPWNAPYILGMRSCLGPLATGNTVILKGSEFSPGPYWAIASVLHEAGLPAGVLNTIIHRPEDAAKVTGSIIASPAVKKVNFTGSTNTGSIIASLSGRYLKPCVMELGGKAPTIVCEDADINAAALGCVLGSFLHSGQICMATERIIVHEKVADKFREALKATTDAVFGKGTGMILVNKQSVNKNRALLKDAAEKGANFLHGDPYHIGDGCSMPPIIVDKVTKEMDIYETESFGPTVSLFQVTSDEEAIELANDTDYGLTAAVFTEDLRRGIRIAKQIESGAVHINSMSVHDESVIPHGGMKKSGFGRFNGAEGLSEWVRTQAITWRD